MKHSELKNNPTTKVSEENKFEIQVLVMCIGYLKLLPSHPPHHLQTPLRRRPIVFPIRAVLYIVGWDFLEVYHIHGKHHGFEQAKTGLLAGVSR
jgi:hypothetical protein